MILKSLAKVALLAVFFFLMAERPAHAYLDPGSGAMILQVLLGGIAGAAVIVKLYWRRFLSLFSGRNSGGGLDSPQS